MVDVFAIILQWISRIILLLTTPSNLFIFLKGNLLRISSGLEVMLGYICFAEFGVVELSRDYFTKFGVFEFFWDRQNSHFLLIGLA